MRTGSSMRSIEHTILNQPLRRPCLLLLQFLLLRAGQQAGFGGSAARQHGRALLGRLRLLLQRMKDVRLALDPLVQLPRRCCCCLARAWRGG